MVCERCQKETERGVSLGGRMFCSLLCANEWINERACGIDEVVFEGKVPLRCFYCGGRFGRIGYARAEDKWEIFCSKECLIKFYGKKLKKEG